MVFKKGRPPWNKGKKCSQIGRKGTIFTEEHKNNLSISHLGKPKNKNAFIFPKNHKYNVGRKQTKSSFPIC